jgi:hypothetical protein
MIARWKSKSEFLDQMAESADEMTRLMFSRPESSAGSVVDLL